MKILWTLDDLVPGMKIATPLHNERSLIGYCYDVSNGSKKVSGAKHLALISLSDGNVMRYQDPKDLLNYLNETCYVPMELFDIPTTQSLWGLHEAKS